MCSYSVFVVRILHFAKTWKHITFTLLTDIIIEYLFCSKKIILIRCINIYAIFTSFAVKKCFVYVLNFAKENNN